ncbi:MAG: hypothetical protein GF334_01220 [Candidatus Altiarchaeales archaeon]|nr:hypothetical protein [Candidatus Altiarchaeales archaeon]
MPVSPTTSSYEFTRDDFVLNPHQAIVASYTLDQDYVTEETLVDGESRKILRAGTIVAMNPSDDTIVPNYTTYGFGELGILYQDADTEDGDAVVPVVLEAEVKEDVLVDNGTYGTVLAATKTALSGRVTFHKSNRL